MFFYGSLDGSLDGTWCWKFMAYLLTTPSLTQYSPSVLIPYKASVWSELRYRDTLAEVGGTSRARSNSILTQSVTQSLTRSLSHFQRHIIFTTAVSGPLQQEPWRVALCPAVGGRLRGGEETAEYSAGGRCRLLGALGVKQGPCLQFGLYMLGYFELFIENKYAINFI